MFFEATRESTDESFRFFASSLFVRSFSWTFIQSSQTVSVVPFRHDEYPRFIVGAIPYYSGAASTSVAFLLFCAVWLGWKEEKVSKGEKEE